MEVKPRAHILTVPGGGRDHLVDELGEHFDLCRHEDPERRGIMTNWAGALRCSVDEGLPWSIVLQDDVRVYANTVDQLEKALTWSPTPLLGLMWCGKMIRSAALRNLPYVKGRFVLRGGAVAYREDVLRPLASFATYAAQTTYLHDDIAACYWADWTGHEVAVTSRTLFETVISESFVGHSPLGSGTYTLENTPDIPWSRQPCCARQNSRRGDAERFRASMEEVGWTP